MVVLQQQPPEAQVAREVGAEAVAEPGLAPRRMKRSAVGTAGTSPCGFLLSHDITNDLDARRAPKVPARRNYFGNNSDTRRF